MKLSTNNDTIAAIATPNGRGGVGIIRISGAKAVAIAMQLTQQNTPFKGRYAHFKRFYAEDNAVLDEGLVLYFPNPHSFTGEDVIEISCHGSPVVLAEVLRLLISLGADLAQPGEFSLRAFLNQRLDLAQAEAIDAGVVRHHGQIFHATGAQRIDQRLGNAAQAKAADSQQLAIAYDAFERSTGAGVNLVHRGVSIKLGRRTILPFATYVVT